MIRLNKIAGCARNLLISSWNMMRMISGSDLRNPFAKNEKTGESTLVVNRLIAPQKAMSENIVKMPRVWRNTRKNTQ